MASVQPRPPPLSPRPAEKKTDADETQLPQWKTKAVNFVNPKLKAFNKPFFLAIIIGILTLVLFVVVFGSLMSNCNAESATLLLHDISEQDANGENALEQLPGFTCVTGTSVLMITNKNFQTFYHECRMSLVSYCGDMSPASADNAACGKSWMAVGDCAYQNVVDEKYKLGEELVPSTNITRDCDFDPTRELCLPSSLPCFDFLVANPKINPPTMRRRLLGRAVPRQFDLHDGRMSRLRHRNRSRAPSFALQA